MSTDIAQVVRDKREEILRIAASHGAHNVRIFGSVARGEEGPDSDVDFLVTFENDDSGPWMCKLTELENELSVLLQRDVDVVHRHGIEQSNNWIRREAILGSVRIVYAA